MADREPSHTHVDPTGVPDDAAEAADASESSGPPAAAAGEEIEVEDGLVQASASAAAPPADAQGFEGATPPPPGKRAVRRFRYHELLAGKYRLEKSLARGGMGRVFLATQLPLERKVAVKVLVPQPDDDAFQHRFLLEASTCARLTHQSIVTIHDYGQTEQGDLFMAMEYLDGPSLSRALTEAGRFSSARATRIAIQIARALRAAHRIGVVHRDLKPSNIMLLRSEDDDGDELAELVKVVDFGIAKLYEPNTGAGALELTRAGMLLGSPKYMAPEQIRNRGVDPRADIYALGGILFSMLTGRPPFEGDNPTDVLTQHLRDAPPTPSEVARDLDMPRELDRIVLRCMQKRPVDRYQNTDELLSDLRSVHRAAEGGAALTPSAVAPLPPLPDTELPPPIPERTLEDSGTLAAADNMVENVTAPPTHAGWWALVLVLLALVGSLAFWALVLTE